LLAWDKRPNTLTRVGNLLMDQREHAKALELFDKAANSLRDWNYKELLMSLAKCRAKLGQSEDLVKLADQLLRSNNAEWRLQNLQGWLSAEGFHDLAARVIESRLKKLPEKLDLYAALAAAHSDAGRVAEAFAAYESAAKVFSTARLGELQAGLANLLLERNWIGEALKRREAADSPLLTGALIEVFARSSEKSERATTLAQVAAGFQTDSAELQIKLADALARMKRNDEAAVRHERRALRGPEPTPPDSEVAGTGHSFRGLVETDRRRTRSRCDSPRSVAWFEPVGKPAPVCLCPHHAPQPGGSARDFVAGF